jgi:hypothetical protein
MTMTRSWFTRPTTVPHPSRPPLAAATSVEDRQAVIEALAAERARAGDISRRLAADAARAREDELAAWALHREATARREEAVVAELAESLAQEQRVRVLEAQLTAGAPECLDRFLYELLAVEEETRRAVETRSTRGHQDPVTLARGPFVFSNAASVAARLAAIRAAYRAAEALRLTALTEPEVIERLTALRDGIPAADPPEVDQRALYSPGELRAIEWRAEESRERRWSSVPREW